MAATVVVKSKTLAGSKWRHLCEVTLDAAYATGGYEVTPKQCGLRTIDDAPCNVVEGSGAEAVAVGSARYLPATKKLKVLSYKTQAEIANASNLATVVVQMEAWGRR